MITIERVDALAREPHSVVISCQPRLNVDYLLDRMWDYLQLTRVYTKPGGTQPDFTEPVVLTRGRNGVTVEATCVQIHHELKDNFKFARVWGKSVKHQVRTRQRVLCPMACCCRSPLVIARVQGQMCGLSHQLADEDGTRASLVVPSASLPLAVQRVLWLTMCCAPRAQCCKL